MTALERIKMRLAAATEGPWECEQAFRDIMSSGHHDTDMVDEYFVSGPIEVEIDGDGRENFICVGAKGDAEFIASSRTDMTLLIAALEESERQKREFATKIDELCTEIDGFSNPKEHREYWGIIEKYERKIESILEGSGL